MEDDQVKELARAFMDADDDADKKWDVFCVARKQVEEEHNNDMASGDVAWTEQEYIGRCRVVDRLIAKAHVALAEYKQAEDKANECSRAHTEACKQSLREHLPPAAFAALEQIADEEMRQRGGFGQGQGAGCTKP